MVNQYVKGVKRNQIQDLLTALHASCSKFDVHFGCIHWSHNHVNAQRYIIRSWEITNISSLYMLQRHEEIRDSKTSLDLYIHCLNFFFFFATFLAFLLLSEREAGLDFSSDKR